MSLIIAPIITEKTMLDANREKFTFKVKKASNKNEIKKEIEKRFDVHVIDISTVIVKGKSSTVMTRTRKNNIEKSPWKKAIVKVKKGEKIGLFELGEEKK